MRVTDSADMRHVVSVRNGSHNTAAWLPDKARYSIRNLRHEGEMRDQIPDAAALPPGLPEEETLQLTAYLRLRVT